MSDWSFGASVPYQRLGTVLAITDVGVRAGTIVNTKGTWHDLGVLAIDAGQMAINLHDYSDSFNNMMIDIGIGDPGQESTIFGNLTATKSNVFQTRILTLPTIAPSGAHVVARAQNDGTAGTPQINIGILIYGINFKNPSPPRSTVHYGPSVSLSRGVLVDPGASANVKSAWVEITSGTSIDHSSLLITIQGDTDTVKPAGNALIDIGIGTSGNEVVILPNLPSTFASSDDHLPVMFGPFLLSIPSGTRIVARVQSSDTSGTRQIYVDVIGHK